MVRDDDAITSVGGKDGSKMTDLSVSASVKSVEWAHECKLPEPDQTLDSGKENFNSAEYVEALDLENCTVPAEGVCLGVWLCVYACVAGCTRYTDESTGL
ncbi:hypothetical protein POX_e07191 [Penicillium oxalicum]|uniref:hypothetical protein n=1 Tax=Penicillium oxalicum TaxID=69781 RepID=UPI0020B643C7|nr:hypothetical protein POX_e07191 [Penicillium oxalicum]KAI2789163.1 hypothetical protein POX_e07191 [Penicillium oxalicum]